jgi:asparagine synthase (glutamine-hydrolysing)
MCGICGLSFGDQHLVKRMCDSIAHRGPDDAGIYTDGKVTLGHRRLSIIDLSQAGRQPMANEDGSIQIVFNGEVYNFGEIRPLLVEMGHSFMSHTDTEVIIHAYEAWGFDCVRRFNGMWSFAVYDSKKGTLFLSRDRFGVKPLYYHISKRGIIFCSEIKGLLEAGAERSANPKAVMEFLAFGFADHDKETFFNGIFRLMPGESLIYDLSRGSHRLIRWYDLESEVRRKSPMSEDEAARSIRSLFEDAVRYRMISDVPVGSCLSGGIDSSAIVCAMRQIAEKGRIKTFSLVFPKSRIDESSYIDLVIERTRVESHTVTPTQTDLLSDLSDLIKTQEEPFGTLSIYGQYRVMKLARDNGMKVLLDGQGADELFAGYFIYFKYYIFQSILLGRMDEAAAAAEAIGHNKQDLLMFPVATIASRWPFIERLLQRLWVRELKHLNEFYAGRLVNPFSERGFDLFRALFTDLTRYSIPQLLRYEDKNSMRWSIETRVPFLDYRLVELSLSFPSDFKVRNGGTKYILRRALLGLVPDKILARTDKIGFATPDKEWFRTPEFIKLMKDLLAQQAFSSRPYWKAEEVLRLLQDHAAGRRAVADHLWRVVNVELWLQAFIDVRQPES